VSLRLITEERQTMSNITQTDLFKKVRENIGNTVAIAWCGCHKIYMAMDQQQADWFYDNYKIVYQEKPELMLERLGRWYENSCNLRFIEAVYSTEDDHAEFINMIRQFEDQPTD
jgi:hypothetical protein